MNLQRGAVVIASLGDHSGKPRPHVVLRSDHFAGHRLAAVLAITNALADAHPLRVTIAPTPENGLREPSQAMIDHIRAVRITRISQEIGFLSLADMHAITRALAVYLGLAD